jgi:vitamin B12 transporter
MTIKSLSLITATLLLTANTDADENIGEITVISPSKTVGSISNTTANIEVITSEDIEEKGYQTVAQAIEQQAGILISRSGGLGQPVSVFTRGMNSGQTLVLLDGMRLNDPSTPNGAAHLETLTTSNIQQIEVTRGGSSSIWGSNASAGVINIITKEAKEGIHGSIALNYGLYNTRGADADLSYKDEKLTAQILASILKTDGFSALAPRDAEEDAYENKNANIKLAYTFNENNKVNFSYNRIKTKTQYDGQYSVDKENDDYSNGTADQTNYALKYDFKLNNYSATLQASKGEFDRDLYENSTFGNSHNIYRSVIKEYSLINAYDYTQGKAILGLEYKDIDGFNHYLSSYPSLPTESAYTNKAIFFSNIYNINDNTLLETNLRYDSYDEFDNKTTYKIGLKHMHQFLEGFITSANYYTSYDAPTTYQLATPIPGSLLNPSYTKGFDVTASYKKLLTITYFNNKVEDNIDYIGVWPNAGYSNVDGESKFSGLEVSSTYAPLTNLILTANYTHLIDFEKEDGTDLPRRAKDTINASATYYSDNNMHFGVDMQYIGDRMDIDTNNGVYDFTTGKTIYPEVPTGNYTLWNLNFGAKITEDLDLNINARNIFDKEYQSVYGYATASVYAKVKYSF